MAQVTSPDPLAHVTCTYGSVYPACRADLDAERRALNNGLVRAGLYGFWRLEFQRSRGKDNEFFGLVPHWHLLTWETQPGGIDRFCRWWKQHTKNPEEASVKVTPGDEGKALWYMALHAMKMDQSPSFRVGRWWGKFDSDRVKKWSRLELLGRAVGDREIIWLKRLYRRKTKGRGSLGTQGFTWFLKEQDHVRVLSCVQNLVDG